jgi:hypothetical protein
MRNVEPSNNTFIPNSSLLIIPRLTYEKARFVIVEIPPQPPADHYLATGGEGKGGYPITGGRKGSKAGMRSFAAPCGTNGTDMDRPRFMVDSNVLIDTLLSSPSPHHSRTLYLPSGLMILKVSPAGSIT